MSCAWVLGVAMLMQTPLVPTAPTGLPPTAIQGAASRDQQTRPPVVGKASLSGTVVSESGQPLKGARVSLNGGSVGRTVMTDAGGAFLFDKLPEGRYTLTASRPRYLSSSYGQKRPERPGVAVPVLDGEQVKNLTITLFGAAVITGTVYNEDGEPVQGAQVRALRYSLSNGFRRLQVSNSGQTDDRGAYRLFGLMPGDYVVTATSNQVDVTTQITTEMALAIERATAANPNANIRMDNGVFTMPGGETLEAPSPQALAPTYYPNASSPTGASTVTVRTGEERSGIDVSMQRVQTATVSGVVLSSGGPLPQNISIQLALSEDGGQGVALPSARVQPDGRFTIRAVPPGQYIVTARATSTLRREMPATPSAGGLPLQTVQTVQVTETGRAMIAVNGQPLNGVVITLDAGHTVSGRVIFQGGVQPDVTRVRMVATLQPAPSASTSPQTVPPPAEIAADGSFKFTGVAPGRYILRASGANGWSLKSSIVAGRDSLDFPFEVEGDDVIGAALTMVQGVVPAELNGMITDGQSKPVSDYSIVVFSSDQRFWGPGSRRIFNIRPGIDGKYSVRGLPAGDYQIAAVADLEPGTQYDPEWLKSLLVASTRVTIGEGAKVLQDLRINIQ